MATITRYVDPDAAAGGDGTSTSLSGSNCAYTSLSAWEAARQGDLVTAGNIEKVICCSSSAPHSADTTAIAIDGWTTSASCYWWITTDTASKAGTSWSLSKYRLSITGDLAVENFESYGILDGLQVEVICTSAGTRRNINSYPSGAGGVITICNCLCRQTGAGSSGGQIIRLSAPGSGTQVYNLYNNILIGKAGWSYLMGIYDSSSSNTTYCYNNTIHAVDYGMWATGTFVAKNNLLSAIGTPSVTYMGSFASGTDYNASSSSDDIGTGSNNKVSQTFSFTSPDAGSEDLSLTSSDSGARDSGADLSADAYCAFSTDILGHTRSSWDIGAFEYVTSAGGNQDGSSSDGIECSDSIIVVVVYSMSAVDGVALSDAVSKQTTQDVAVVDSTLLSDTVNQNAGFNVVASDEVHISDVTSKTASMFVASADGIKLIDLSTNGLHITAEASDTFVVTDTPAQTSKFNVSCNDGMNLGDSQSRLTQQFVDAADILQFSETVSVLATILKTLVDGISLTDSGTGTQRSPQAITDGSKFGETIGAYQQSIQAATDGIVLTDTPSFIAKFIYALTDGVKLSDSSAQETENEFVGLVADGIYFGDVVTKSASHLLSISDGVKISEALALILSLQAALSDGTSYSDNATWATIITALASEGITLSDVTSQIMKKIVFAADSIVLTDTGSVQAIYNLTVSETVNMMDVLTTAMTLYAALTDGASLSDASFDAGINVTGTVTISATWRKVGVDITVHKISTTIRQPK